MALEDELQPGPNGSMWIAFRGKPIECLRSVIPNGVDVDPTDRTIFCGDYDKAFEYTRPSSDFDGPGLIYALHGGYLERSHRVLPADASPEQIAEVRKTYPYEYPFPYDGLYFSRLVGQENTAYEFTFGYWVPGNARDALLAVFLIGRMDEVMEALRTAVA
jgi:hypothetical protein